MDKHLLTRIFIAAATATFMLLATGCGERKAEKKATAMGPEETAEAFFRAAAGGDFDKGPKNMHIRMWKNHISELINELYNALVFGNLFSVAAMTRTLIECFVYFSILDQPGNEQLIHHWYICNLCYSQKDSDTLCNKVQEYCQLSSLDFKEMWKTYSTSPSTKRWLKPLMPQDKSLNFETYCNYLKEPQIYKDYESACSFVHGQDLTSKTQPFTFYHSICHRFDMMMLYIFRTLRLFPLTELLDAQLTNLENELITVSKKYFK